MAGRGRGRGRGLTFNVEQLGIGRGEALPAPPSQQPPPLFPPLFYKPLPLLTSAEYEYRLHWKHDFGRRMHESMYVVKPHTRVVDIERYSDKYLVDVDQRRKEFQFDPRRFPHELKNIKKRKKISSLTARPKKTASKLTSSVDIAKTLEALENKEGEEKDDEDEAKKEKKGDDEEEEQAVESDFYEEEEQEEGTDYNLTYFDNGDDNVDDEDDNLDDGPIY